MQWCKVPVLLDPTDRTWTQVFYYNSGVLFCTPYCTLQLITVPNEPVVQWGSWKKCMPFLGCIKRGRASRSREVTILLCYTVARPAWSAVFSFGLWRLPSGTPLCLASPLISCCCPYSQAGTTAGAEPPSWKGEDHTGSTTLGAACLRERCPQLLSA